MTKPTRADTLTDELAELRNDVADQSDFLRNVQELLDRLVNIVTPNVNNHPPPTIATPFVNTTPPYGKPLLRPATPNEFDGARNKGRAFLNSCELYMRLVTHPSLDDATRIAWTLSFMKSGRASTFAERILRYQEKHGQIPYGSWTDFRADFIETFCPQNEAQRALTRLETAAFHQGSRSVDEYTDEFRDLIKLAGYTDGLVIVMKYRRGLEEGIQTQLATMTVGQPRDNQPAEWYKAAARCDENRRTNEAFCTEVRAHVGQVESGTADTCERCVGEHTLRECPHQHDSRFMTMREKLHFVQQTLAALPHRRTAAPKVEVRAAMPTEEISAAVPPADAPVPRNTANRLVVLEVEPTDTNDAPTSQIVTPTPARIARIRVPKWERQLPKRYVLATTPGPKSLNLKVELQTTDTGDVLTTDALLDSGATGMFIDTEYVRKHRLTTRALARAIPVYNVDGTANEAGAITGVVDMVLHYKGHTERVQLAVTGLGKQDLILGYTWLRKHNPEVDWQTNEVKMSRCPAKCRTCTEEEKADKREQRAELRRVQTCRAGPTPSVDDDLYGIPDTPGIEEEDEG